MRLSPDPPRRAAGRGRTHAAVLADLSIGSTVTAAATGAMLALTAYYAARCCQGDDVTVVGPAR